VRDSSSGSDQMATQTVLSRRWRADGGGAKDNRAVKHDPGGSLLWRGKTGIERMDEDEISGILQKGARPYWAGLRGVYTNRHFEKSRSIRLHWRPVTRETL